MRSNERERERWGKKRSLGGSQLEDAPATLGDVPGGTLSMSAAWQLSRDLKEGSREGNAFCNAPPIWHTTYFC